LVRLWFVCTAHSHGPMFWYSEPPRKPGDGNLARPDYSLPATPRPRGLGRSLSLYLVPVAAEEATEALRPGGGEPVYALGFEVLALEHAPDM
jgi:hypothetical protein